MTTQMTTAIRVGELSCGTTNTCAIGHRFQARQRVLEATGRAEHLGSD